MPLLKILCIAAATLGLHVASTSPNPPLVSSARTIAPTSVEFILVSPSFREAQKIIYWCAAIAETAILVAQLSPQSIASQLVISVLALGGDLPTLRLTPLLVLGCALIISGAILRFLCYCVLGKYFTFETGIARDHRLITTGPYSVVRHPSYTGAILAYLGILCYYGSPGSWFMECVFKGSMAGTVFCATYIITTSLVVTGLLSRISKEDEGLRGKFGDEWEVFAARVPYVLMPGIY
ncbi:hypothetical protein B0H17DRAFT_1181582 [Mycena rosella]|uniref:Protein-S-isoprenylcysteine O-methyltransferase n=1 Tax=Mycena rosella TaxID=1033263 RepID=A0AAD7D8G7_MYCRO|nr:hypothetical protein B0H17DRAFT_1181582 [Mycena rosella]